MDYCSWVVPQTIPTPAELAAAIRYITRKLVIDRYRSRTDVTIQHINGAFAWYKLPIITQDNDYIPADPNSMRYLTFPIKRGIPEELALQMVKDKLNTISMLSSPFQVIMFNSSTAAAATETVTQWFDADENWNEIDIATMVTSAPNHKVKLYKHTEETYNKVIYAIINNIDTPTVLYKLAAAIMLDTNKFGENTRTLAEAWMSGTGDTICTAIINYYEAYKAEEEKRRKENALNELCTAMSENRDSEFKRKIEEVQNEIDQMLTMLRDYNVKMDKIKGEYLLYKLSNEDEKAEELKKFIESCGNAIRYINYDSGILYLVYKTSLMYYEPDLLKNYFRSTRNNSVNGAPAWKQQLLKDIFLENKYTLLIESGVALNIRNITVHYYNPTSNNICPDISALTGIPNPHHMYYDCWGDNLSNIIKALREKDYITAILTSFAAMSGLSISDIAVITKFIERELDEYSNVGCLKNKETGEILTITEYRRGSISRNAQAAEGIQNYKGVYKLQL